MSNKGNTQKPESKPEKPVAPRNTIEKAGKPDIGTKRDKSGR